MMMSLESNRDASHSKEVMQRAIALMSMLAVTLPLGGCAWWHSVNFRAHDSSGVDADNQKAMLMVISDGDKSTHLASMVLSRFGSAPDLAMSCGQSSTGTSPSSQAQIQVAPEGGAAIPIVAEFLLNQAAEWQLRQVEKLRKEANPDPYTVRAMVSGATFHAARCIAVVRYKGPGAVSGTVTMSPANAGLIAIWKIDAKRGTDPMNDAFVLTPVYFRAANSIAKSAPGKQGFPRMNVAVAMSIRYAGIPPSTQAPTIHTLGPIASTLSKVEFGCDSGGSPCAAAACTMSSDACAPTDLIPYPPRGASIAIVLSVVELGDVGIDFDVAKADLKAIRDVRTPSAKSVLEARFEP